MSITKGKYGRRIDEEFKREVADLASKPGARQQQVARDLGVSPYRVARWKSKTPRPRLVLLLASTRRRDSNSRTGRCAASTRDCAHNARS